MRVSAFKNMHFIAFGVLSEFWLFGCRFMNLWAPFALLFPSDSNMGLLLCISSFFTVLFFLWPPRLFL